MRLRRESLPFPIFAVRSRRGSRDSVVPTRSVTVRAIIRSKTFNEGVSDVRRGRAPRFEREDFEYERGRQWATVAPMSMPTMINGKVNPAAMSLFFEVPII